jgi:hypothetical protein
VTATQIIKMFYQFLKVAHENTNAPIKFFSAKLGKFAPGTQVWTSGANDGLNCDTDQRFEWCSVRKLVQQNLLPPTKSPAKNDTCLTLTVTNSQTELDIVNCSSSKHQYLCEVKVNSFKLVQ